jgi:hypothetical protein
MVCTCKARGKEKVQGGSLIRDGCSLFLKKTLKYHNLLATHSTPALLGLSRTFRLYARES